MMRILHFGLVLSVAPTATCFLPQTENRQLRPLANSNNNNNNYDQRQTYLNRIQQFEALTRETYARQQTEIQDILNSLRIIEERVEARENHVREQVYVPPPPPPPPVSFVPPPPPPPVRFVPPPPPPPPVNGELELHQYNIPPPSPVNGHSETTTGRPTTSVHAPIPWNEPANGVEYSHTIPLDDDDTYTYSNGILERELPSTYSLFAGKTFQLEELEDQDGCATEITLEEDHTITVGATDGPIFSQATGTWICLPDQLDMVITRYFDAGHKSKTPTDIGEFSFGVERSYLGQVIKVGDRLAVSGTIHLSDFDYDIEGPPPVVGHFNMIDNHEDEEDDKEGLGEVKPSFVGSMRSRASR